MRKIFLGPGAPVPCQTCDKTVKVGLPDWLKAALPGATIMVAALFFDSDLMVYGLSLFGLALTIGCICCGSPWSRNDPPTTPRSWVPAWTTRLDLSTIKDIFLIYERV